MTNFLTKDLGWKLFSLFLAVAIWLTVHQIDIESETPSISPAGNTVTYRELPLLVVSSAANVSDYRLTRTSVTVVVNVPQDLMSSLATNQVKATVDLTDISPATASHRHVEISMPAGLTLVSVTPEYVDVILPPKH